MIASFPHFCKLIIFILLRHSELLQVLSKNKLQLIIQLPKFQEIMNFKRNYFDKQHATKKKSTKTIGQQPVWKSTTAMGNSIEKRRVGKTTRYVKYKHRNSADDLKVKKVCSFPNLNHPNQPVINAPTMIPQHLPSFHPKVLLKRVLNKKIRHN